MKSATKIFFQQFFQPPLTYAAIKIYFCPLAAAISRYIFSSISEISQNSLETSWITCPQHGLPHALVIF